MGVHTEGLPKGLLSIQGRSLIEWQLGRLRDEGVRDIIVVTGYRAEMLVFPGVSYYHNPSWADTNMVETLMCARAELRGDLLVSYSDIIYTQDLLHLALRSAVDIGVAADADWRAYWLSRFGTTETDLETLTVSSDGRITELGSPANSSEGLDYRYIGLLKFSGRGLSRILQIYDERKELQVPWPKSGKPFEQGYMTDLLQEAIVSGIEVTPIVTRGGWMEFDCAADYELACSLRATGRAEGLFV